MQFWSELKIVGGHHSCDGTLMLEHQFVDSDGAVMWVCLSNFVWVTGCSLIHWGCFGRIQYFVVREKMGGRRDYLIVVWVMVWWSFRGFFIGKERWMDWEKREIVICLSRAWSTKIEKMEGGSEGGRERD